MRLYLSSFRMGDHVAALQGLLGRVDRSDAPTVALVANALDGLEPGIRRERVAEETARLMAAGFAVTELDLREHPTVDGLPRGDLWSAVAGNELIWLRGGNVFTLRQASAASGFDAVLRELVTFDQAVIGG